GVERTCKIKHICFSFDNYANMGKKNYFFAILLFFYNILPFF
ncbi:hypothetical protein AAJ76_3750001429, partial [Vairimorpha ceranae]